MLGGVEPSRHCIQRGIQMTPRSVILVAMLSPLFAAGAQLVPVKTVPVAGGDQFGFFPSANLGMGGVSIALADSLRDPFTNPAKGSRLRRGQVFGSPSFYSLSKNAGSGSTLPIGALIRAGSSFGALAVAIQEIRPPSTTSQLAVPTFSSTIGPRSGQPDLDPRTNQYAFAMLGHEFVSPRLSIAGSVLWSGLRRTDGVDVLYPTAQSIGEVGDAVNLRAGILKEWRGDQSLEAVVVHNRYAMSHDLRYLDFFWDPGTQQPIPSFRSEQNFDRTHTTGLHLKYDRPLADSGWRIGLLANADRTTHLAIPQLGAMSLGRDPGESSAFDVGIGMAKSKGPATFGVDAIYEPIWSRAAIPGTVDQGRFRFSNMVLRSGVAREFASASAGTSLRLQLGMQLRAIGYRLDHDDLTRGVTRDSWTEWTHSWGATFHTRDLDFRYLWRLQSGTGRPGFDNGGDGPRPLDIFSPFAPPTTALVLVPVRVTMHQLSISLPIQ
jgi:hypothetical protein